MKKRKMSIKGHMPVQYFKEGDMFVAFAPSLDLSTCGETLSQAKKNFSKALELFYQECIKHGTLHAALSSCSAA